MTLGLLSECGYICKTASAAAQAARLVLAFVLFQQCGELCHAQFYVSFSLLLFAGSFAGHFKNTMVPYQQVNYHLDLH